MLKKTMRCPWKSCNGMYFLFSLFPALPLSGLTDVSDLELQICLKEGKEVSVGKRTAE